MNLDTDLILSTKIKSKWIIGINTKYKTVKLIEEIQMPSEYIKRCCPSCVITELKMQTTTGYHYTPIRIDKIKTLTTPNADRSVEQQELSFTIGGNAKLHSYFRRYFDGFLQN